MENNGRNVILFFPRFNRTSCANILFVHLPQVCQRQFDDFLPWIIRLFFFEKNIIDSATSIQDVPNEKKIVYVLRIVKDDGRRSLTLHVKSGLKQKFAAIERERKSRLVLLAVYSVRSAHYAHLYYKRRVLSISSVVLKVPRFKIGTDENSRNVRGVFSHNQPSSCHIRRWGGNDNVSRFSFSVKIRLARPHALVNLLRLQRTRYSAMFRPIVRGVCLRVERTVVYTTVHTQSHVWFMYFSGNRWMTCSGFGKTPWFFADHPTEARTPPPPPRTTKHTK